MAIGMLLYMEQLQATFRPFHRWYSGRREVSTSDRGRCWESFREVRQSSLDFET